MLMSRLNERPGFRAHGLFLAHVHAHMFYVICTRITHVVCLFTQPRCGGGKCGRTPSSHRATELHVVWDVSYEPGPGTLSRPMLSACTNLLAACGLSPSGNWASRRRRPAKKRGGFAVWRFRDVGLLHAERFLHWVPLLWGPFALARRPNPYSGENRGTVSAWHQCPHAVSVLRCEHHAVGRRVHQHQAARHHKRRVAQAKIAMSNFPRSADLVLLALARLCE